MATRRASDAFFLFYLAVLCWAPLPLASNRPWAWNLLALLCLLLGSLIVLQALRNDRNILQRLHSFRWAIGLLALVPLWSSLQTLTLPVEWLTALSGGHAALLQGTPIQAASVSLDASLSRQYALLGWAYWTMFVLTLLLLDTPARMRTAMFVLVLSGLAQALYGSVMTLSGLEYGFFVEKTAYRGFATGTFINRNHLAGYLELCLAVGIGLLVASLARHHSQGWRNRMRSALDTFLGPKIRLRVFLALMVVALVLTRSRMGNAAFFISLPLCGLLLMLLQRKFNKGALILFASLMLIDFLIVGQWFGFDELAERMQTTSVETESRDEVIRDSLPLLSTYAMTGTGQGTFYTAFPAFRSPEVLDFYDHAHNDYLELGIELGVPMLLVLGLSVGYAALISMRSMAVRRDQLARGVAFAALMAIVSLAIHSAVDFNLQIPANALLFVVLLAFAHLSRQLPRESSPATA